MIDSPRVSELLSQIIGHSKAIGVASASIEEHRRFLREKIALVCSFQSQQVPFGGHGLEERTVSFEVACRTFTNRFTMEHKPTWARTQAPNGAYYAPQYFTDKEWYANTFFTGEHPLACADSCFSTNHSWPLGMWLPTEYYP